jgi:hypothetical protein
MEGTVAPLQTSTGGLGVGVGVGVGVGIGATRAAMLINFTPVTPRYAAPIFVLPAPRPVTSPLTDTIATRLLDDVHDDSPPTALVVASE